MRGIKKNCTDGDGDGAGGQTNRQTDMAILWPTMPRRAELVKKLKLRKLKPYHHVFLMRQTCCYSFSLLDLNILDKD